jgi:alanine racemase
MTLKASVMKVQVLKKGECLGYGATWCAAEDSRPVATLSAGYADGIHRALSNQGYVWLSGRAERFLGRISMDMSAVSCGAATKVGEWAELIGPRVDPWAQAKAAGTLPYEVLTSVSPRVQRQYG